MSDENERLRLTEDERAAIEEAWCAIGRSDDHSEFAKKRIRAALRGLLERLK